MVDHVYFRRPWPKANQIAAPLILMLKTLRNTNSTTRPGKGRLRVGSNGGDNGGHDDKHSP